MKLLPCTLATSVSMLFAANLAHAVKDTEWDGSDGNWYDRSAWSAGLPSPATNAVVPTGDLTIQSYAQARLIRVGTADKQSASLTVAEGGTLEIGAAGVSLLGVGQGSRGDWIQEGGRIVMGNHLYLGGFLSSGDGEANYQMQDGILNIHGGDLVLGGNTTGSSKSRFEQKGGSVTVDNLLIGSERYRGMQSSNANDSVYSAQAGSLTIAEFVKIGSESAGGKGEADAMFQVGSEAMVHVEKGLAMFASKQSRPVLSFLINGDAPGMLEFSNTASVTLGGELDIELNEGVALLKASEFGLVKAKTEQVSGEFASMDGSVLWKLDSAGSSPITITLVKDAQRAALNRSARPRDEFAASSSGYVALEGMREGEAFDCYLNVAPGSGESLESILEKFTKAGFEARIDSGKYIAFRAVATASTMYFIWEFDGGLSPARISAVAL